jgi:hypothetical protein
MYNDLKRALHFAQQVCPPDEYDLRQRRLLYVLTNYILERDYDESTPSSEEVSSFVSETVSPSP